VPNQRQTEAEAEAETKNRKQGKQEQNEEAKQTREQTKTKARAARKIFSGRGGQCRDCDKWATYNYPGQSELLPPVPV
jgi:hypothetical protein